jgi:hypothetical protein
VRHREHRRRAGHALPPEEAPIVPELATISYGPWLRMLAELRSAVAERSLSRFMALRNEIDVTPRVEQLKLRKLVEELDSAAEPLLRGQVPALEAALADACALVDQPGETEVGLVRGERSFRLLDLADGLTPLSRAMWQQTRLSAANHFADSPTADAVWREYLATEPALVALGLEGIQPAAEIRNRRAVSLVDVFALDEARQTVVDVLDMQQRALAAIAPLANGTPRSRSVGACYGTLGQIEALSGSPEAALAAFRAALDQFVDPRDRERQWVYLGHLACDLGPEAGAPLWREVCEHVRALRSPDPASGPGMQFVLALQAKAHAVLEPLDRTREHLDRWESVRPLEAWPATQRHGHPFGLVRQGVGLSWERLARSGDTRAEARARSAFAEAAAHMAKAGGLLRVLGAAATLRGALLAAESESAGELAALVAAFRTFQGAVIAHAGAACWDETRTEGGGHFGRLDPGPESAWTARARGVLSGLRHNLW